MWMWWILLGGCEKNRSEIESPAADVGVVTLAVSLVKDVGPVCSQ